MKTILYNPIFINPQAYYVFPNLNGQLVEQKNATIEPAKYSGIIEVKIIANGDIHKIKQFKNTDNIDFTEFSESWVRINQYTLEGNIVLGGYTIVNINQDASVSKDNIDAVYISGSRTDFIKDASATGKLDGRFSVEGRMLNDDSIGECSQVAWYWTFIANRVLTTDEINQVMTYYNLDKYIESAE